MRWMVFDDETAEMVVTQWRRGAAEILHEHPVDAALGVDGAAVLVLPSRVPGQVLVARLKKRPAVVASVPEAVTTIAIESTVRKPWWRKFVA